ncbi:hypothetical protein [Fusobacterium sp. SYSU M8D902]|uniref:hypothetical protein n=1 Tax=Fusobacterium sp. SYSU M8D902 TaxID=3159562 RepID=UPI0032E3C014
MKEKIVVIDLVDYKENFLFIDNKYYFADIYVLIDSLEIDNNSVIPRYCNGIKNKPFNFNLKDELEAKAYEDNNIQEKIELSNFLDLEFLEISENLNKWIQKNILSFKKDNNLKIKINININYIFVERVREERS